jgi:ribosomal protein S18 acetylase RimI-like enzyme
MVSCFVADDPATVFLVGMWVAPELRGTGVAVGLVERIVEWARNHGAKCVCLSVEPDNFRAVRLYEKCGFVETDDPPPFPYQSNEGNRFYVFEL